MLVITIIIAIIFYFSQFWSASIECLSGWLVLMFCVVSILFVYSFVGAGSHGWVGDTAGHGGGSIRQGLSC